MPSFGTRVLEKTLSHLSGTLEQAEQAHSSATVPAAAQLIDARVKVIGAIFMTIAAVSSHHLGPVLSILIALSVLVLLSNVTWKRLLATWASGLFFAAIVAVPAIFTTGWNIALLLVFRSEASLTCWLLVIMTTSFNRVLRALRALHVPAVCVAILLMTFRYILLLVETAQDMLLSRRSRIVGRLSAGGNRKLLISTSGVLLSKSIQMSDDVYHAMTSRGFRGDIHLLEDFNMTVRDWIVLFAVISLSLLLFVQGR